MRAGPHPRFDLCTFLLRTQQFFYIRSRVTSSNQEIGYFISLRIQPAAATAMKPQNSDASPWNHGWVTRVEGAPCMRETNTA
jgi:hypothetical protein